MFRITTPLVCAAALFGSIPAVPALAQPAAVDLDKAVRCSAAFGIVAAQQARGLPGAQDYPALGQRGREFFVQTGARLMDEQKLTREQVQARMRAEALKLQSEVAASPDPGAAIRGVMTPCLTLLDAVMPVR